MMWKIKSLAMVLVLTVCVEFATAEETNMSLVKNLAQGEIPKSITDLMSSQYGARNYNKSKHCWKYDYHEKDISGTEEVITYCMQPKKYVTQNINGKPLTFILANSDGNRPEGGYRLTNGLMGLFVIDGNGKVTSKDKAIITGFWSTTGSDHAEFQQIGKKQYGWIITNGICTQGNCVENYEIYTPIHSNMKVIAMIGRLFEDDQDTIHTLDFINDESEYYSIQIYKNHGEKKEKYKKLIFDKKQNIYIDE